MSLQDDLIKVTEIEVMRRVLEPVDDDIPDPEVNFDACVEGVVKRIRRKVKSLPPGRRHDYFLEHARSSLEWCRRAKLPAQFTEGVEQWLEQLQRRRPS